ncbi:MAG: hypothetical protein ABIT01_03890 [Thermoanaerobaculia bacterium]
MKLTTFVLTAAALGALASQAAGAKPAKPAPGAKAPAFTVTAGDITDRRRNDNFFNRLEIVLKLDGEGLDDVKGARALIRKAADDTGRSLIGDERKPVEFERSMGQGAPTLRLELKNPARRATVLKEVSGQVELFVPARDPNATARMDGFLARVDKPLASPPLKSAKVDVTLVSRKTYDDEKKKDEERRKKESEGSGVAGQMAEAFAGLFSGMMGDIGEHDVLLRVSDPDKKVFSVEVLDGAGKPIDGRGSMKVGGFWILNFPEKLPDEASLRVYLLTSKAVVTLPFALKDVVLP